MTRFFTVLVVALGLSGGWYPAAAQIPRRNDRAVDSLRRVLAQHPNDTTGTKALVSLVGNFLYQDTTQAGHYGREAVRVATALGDKKRLARVHYNLATLAAIAGELEKSVRLHMLSAKEFGELHNTLWVGHNYANASARLVQAGRYTDAMRYALHGLKLREAAHDAYGIADSYTKIGQIYLEQQNLPAAQVAFERSLAGWQKLNISVYILNCINHLAIIHRDAGRFDRARAYVADGLKLAKAQPDSLFSNGLLLTLAVIEQRQSHWAASLPLLRRVENGYKSVPAAQVVPAAWADLYSIMGESLVQTGQPAAAEPYLQKALTFARTTRDQKETADALEGLADLAAARHDYRAAFTFHRELELLNDTLRSVAAARTVTEMQAKYKAVEQEARNQVQAAQLTAQQQVIRRRNIQLFGGLALALALAGLAYLLYNRRRLRREVEFAQERQQLERQRAQAVLDAEEAERRRIGADLHDGVGQLLSVVKLGLGSLREDLALTASQQSQFGEAIELVDESVREVRGISHNLLPNALIKRGLARAVREFLDVVDHAGRIRVHLELLGFDTGRLPSTTESTLYRVIQELVQNIIKHAQATEMTIQLVRHEAEVTLLVEDNGVGFDPAALGPDAGIGLRNIESRVAYLGGSLQVDARPGRGAIITANVPVEVID